MLGYSPFGDSKPVVPQFAIEAEAHVGAVGLGLIASSMFKPPVGQKQERTALNPIEDTSNTAASPLLSSSSLPVNGFEAKELPTPTM